MSFFAAMEEDTQEQAPFDWAVVQFNLGYTLELLGNSERNVTRVNEAIMAYDNAISIFEKDGAGFYIEVTQINRNRAVALLEKLP